MEVLDTALRDAYGFAITPAYHPLFTTFSSVWAEEEEERCERWDQWFIDLRVSLKDAETMDDLELMERALKDYTTGGKLFAQSPHTTALLVQLRSLVQLGVPMHKRSQYWKLFLNVNGKKQPGEYQRLVEEALKDDNAALDSYVNTSNEVDTVLLSSSSLSQQQVSSTTNCLVPSSTTTPPPTASDDDDASSDTIILPEGHARPIKSLSAPESSETFIAPSIDESSAATIKDQLHPHRESVSETSPESGSTRANINNTNTTSPLTKQLSAPPDFGKWGERDWISQIDKDLHRTFPSHPMFDEKGKGMLRRILAAYSSRNPTLGYCQGMNFVAASFMLLCPEEDAFWCLAAVVEDILPGYFDSLMIAPQVDALVLTDLLDHSVPSVAAHMTTLEVDAASIASSWFLVAFLNSLPFESCLRVWDVLFFERSPVVLFRVALGLVDIYSQALLETVDPSDAYMLLQAMGPMSFDSSRLIDVACIGFGHIKDAALKVLRDKHRPKVIERMRSYSINSEEIEYYSDLTTQLATQPSSRSQTLVDAITRTTSHTLPCFLSYNNSPDGSQTPLSAASISTPSVHHSPGENAESIVTGTTTTTTCQLSPIVTCRHSSRHHLIDNPLYQDNDDKDTSTVPRKSTFIVNQQGPLETIDNNQCVQQFSTINGVLSPSLEGALSPTKLSHQRRTRSEQVFGAPRHSIGCQWHIDIHELASFVPDFRQPGVAAAYRIAAKPPVFRKSTAVIVAEVLDSPFKKPSINNDDKGLNTAVERPLNLVFATGTRVTNNSAIPGHRGRHVHDGFKAIRTVDFGDLGKEPLSSCSPPGNTAPHSIYEQQQQRHVPRRFTDGGALLLLSKTKPPSPQDGNDGKTLKDLQSLEDSTVVTPKISAVHGSQGFGELPPVQPTSGKLAKEKTVRLRNLHDRLQIEVEAGYARQLETEEQATEVDTLRQELQQQLDKVQDEVDEKVHVLENIKGKVTELELSSTQHRASIEAEKQSIKTLTAELELLNVQSKRQTALQQILMREVHTMSSLKRQNSSFK